MLTLSARHEYNFSFPCGLHMTRVWNWCVYKIMVKTLTRHFTGMSWWRFTYVHSSILWARAFEVKTTRLRNSNQSQLWDVHEDAFQKVLAPVSAHCLDCFTPHPSPFSIELSSLSVFIFIFMVAVFSLLITPSISHWCWVCELSLSFKFNRLLENKIKYSMMNNFCDRWGLQTMASWWGSFSGLF